VTVMKQCPWCHDPAVSAVWTPRHGWIDVCQRHYNETSRDVISHLIESLNNKTVKSEG
jgi:hypothetical protein